MSLRNTTIVLRAVAKCSTTVIMRDSLGRALLPRSALPISKCPLEETGRNSVRPWIMPRTIASIISILSIGVQENSIDLYGKTKQHQGRSQTDASEVVNFFTENIRIVTTAAGHQNKAQGNDCQSNTHHDVVLFSENKFL